MKTSGGIAAWKSPSPFSAYRRAATAARPRGAIPLGRYQTRTVVAPVDGEARASLRIDPSRPGAAGKQRAGQSPWTLRMDRDLFRDCGLLSCRTRPLTPHPHPVDASLLEFAPASCGRAYQPVRVPPAAQICRTFSRNAHAGYRRGLDGNTSSTISTLYLTLSKTVKSGNYATP